MAEYTPIDQDAAAENWKWFQYTESRGHREYCAEATKCDRFYMGKGQQWDQDVKASLNEAGKPTYEINEIKPAVNIALGYQINNRMDVALYPRSGSADEAQAEIKSKVLRQIMDNNQFKWRETEVVQDGLIQQRGYFDLDVVFNDNMQGDINITVLDPLDVRPDPDAKSYDPDEWNFVIITRWWTLDMIEQAYGRAARLEVESSYENAADWGDNSADEKRNTFGGNEGAQACCEIAGIRRVRIIDRQFWVFEMTSVLISPEGDIRTRDSFQDEEIPKYIAAGWLMVKKMMRRVRRVISTSKHTLFDAYSPIDHFTVVPYFPFFRRGKTSGMVDDAISPQEMLNKSVSQFQHIINTSSNSGWMVEKGSLANMTIEDLEERGAETGLVIEYNQGMQKPEKIRPNDVPQGVDRFIDRSLLAIRDVTGINESMLDPGKNQSGVAIQARQFIAQQQLAVPLDNMARTRYMLWCRALKIVKKYMHDERIIRIADKDIDGSDIYTPIVINQRMEDGSIANDMTAGEYDIIITDKPMAVTWENSEFEQAMEMRKNGVGLPDWVPVKHSNLADKGELLKEMRQTTPPDPVKEAEAALKAAQARKADAEATSKAVESLYSATTAASLVARTPEIAGLADAMLKSAGYKDQDAAPIMPTPAAPVAPVDMRENTHPLSPPNPDVGIGRTPAGIGV